MLLSVVYIQVFFTHLMYLYGFCAFGHLINHVVRRKSHWSDLAPRHRNSHWAPTAAYYSVISPAATKCND